MRPDLVQNKSIDCAARRLANRARAASKKPRRAAGGKAGATTGMTITPVQFLIVCPMVFLAGFVDAVAGGGGLISLPSYLIAGVPVHMAIATNKLSSGMGTSLATWCYAKSGYIPWKQALFSVGFALVGSNLGAHLAMLLSDEVFTIVMLIILPLTALYVLHGHTLEQQRTPYSQKKTILLSMGIALVVGVYDGFYGPGTGTFLLLLLTAVVHMNLREANGVTKAINLTTNISALAVFFYNGKVLLPLGLAAGGFNILGNYLGTRFFTRGGAKAVKPVIIVVLAVFFIKIIAEMFF